MISPEIGHTSLPTHPPSTYTTATRRTSVSEDMSLVDKTSSSGSFEEERETFDIDDALEESGFGSFQIKIVLIAGFFLAADAMEMMMLSYLGPTLRCQWGITEEQEALLTTVVFTGMMIGTNAWGYAADTIGRRTTLLIIASLTFVLGLISAASVNYAMMITIRFLLGIMLGGFGVGFSYFMEMLPMRSRGKWGILIELWWTIGTMLEAGLAWALIPTGINGWRWLLGVSAVPLFFVTLSFFYLPESPRFLVVQGRHDEALNVLREIAKTNHKTLPDGQFVQKSNSTKSAHVGIRQVCREITSGGMMRTTMLLWWLWFAVALSYYGIVLMTTATMIVDDETHSNSTVVSANATSSAVLLQCDPVSGTPFSSDDYVSVFIASLSEVPGLLLAMFMIDCIGRKHTLSSMFLATALSVLLMMTYTHNRTLDTLFLFLSRAFIEGVFVAIFVYTPEVYPTKIRTTAFGIANSFGRIGGMLSPFIGQDLMEKGMQNTAQGLIGGVCLVGAICACSLTIETKGRKLDEGAPNQRHGETLDADEFGTLQDAPVGSFATRSSTATTIELA